MIKGLDYDCRLHNRTQILPLIQQLETKLQLGQVLKSVQGKAVKDGAHGLRLLKQFKEQRPLTLGLEMSAFRKQGALDGQVQAGKSFVCQGTAATVPASPEA